MKSLGAFLISMIPAALGFFTRQRILREGKERQGSLDFLKHIHFQIEAFSKEQEEIVSSFESSALTESGFLPRLKEEIEKSPVGALERALPSLMERANWSSEEQKLWKEFAAGFGMQSKKAQLNQTESLIKTIQRREETERPKREKDATLARTVGLCAGLGLFILLI